MVLETISELISALIFKSVSVVNYYYNCLVEPPLLIFVSREFRNYCYLKYCFLKKNMESKKHCVALRFLPDMIRKLPARSLYSYVVHKIYHKVMFFRFCKRSEASDCCSQEQTVINLTATIVMMELMFLSAIVFPNRFRTISGE